MRKVICNVLSNRGLLRETKTYAFVRLLRSFHCKWPGLALNLDTELLWSNKLCGHGKSTSYMIPRRNRREVKGHEQNYRELEKDTWPPHPSSLFTYRRHSHQKLPCFTFSFNQCAQNHNKTRRKSSCVSARGLPPTVKSITHSGVRD